MQRTIEDRGLGGGRRRRQGGVLHWQGLASPLLCCDLYGAQTVNLALLCGGGPQGGPREAHWGTWLNAGAAGTRSDSTPCLRTSFGSTTDVLQSGTAGSAGADFLADEHRQRWASVDDIPDELAQGQQLY